MDNKATWEKEECKEARDKYNECFNKWFAEKYLQGDTEQQPCRELFEAYSKCVEVGCLLRVDVGVLDVNLVGRNRSSGRGSSWTRTKESRHDERPFIGWV